LADLRQRYSFFSLLIFEWFTSYLANLHTETPSLRLPPNTMDENFHGHFKKKKVVGITCDGVTVRGSDLKIQKIFSLVTLNVQQNFHRRTPL